MTTKTQLCKTKALVHCSMALAYPLVYLFCENSMEFSSRAQEGLGM